MFYGIAAIGWSIYQKLVKDLKLELSRKKRASSLQKILKQNIIKITSYKLLENKPK